MAADATISTLTEYYKRYYQLEDSIAKWADIVAKPRIWVYKSPYIARNSDFLTFDRHVVDFQIRTLGLYGEVAP